MRQFKTFIALFLSFLIFNIQSAYSLEVVYKFYNTNKQSAQGTISAILKEKGYYISKYDPIIAQKDGVNIDILLTSEGNNLYYYYNSNSSSKSVNKRIIKKFNYDEINNSSYFQIFRNQLQNQKSGTKKQYDFSDNQKQDKTPVFSQTETRKNPDVMTGYAGYAGKGSKLNVYIQNSLNTATASIGDRVTGVLTEDWKVNGYIAAKKGSVLEGKITKAKSAQAGVRSARVSFEFNKLTTQDGKVYDISTKSIDFVVDNDGKALKVAKHAATGAVSGALTGVLVGGIATLLGANPSSIWKGAVIGAGVGGVTSGASSAFDKGVDVEIPAYTEIEVELSENVNLILNYR